MNKHQLESLETIKSFFDFTKPFKRLSISGGSNNGRMHSNPEYHREPQIRPEFGTEYAKKYQEEEQNRALQVIYSILNRYEQLIRRSNKEHMKSKMAIAHRYQINRIFLMMTKKILFFSISRSSFMHTMYSYILILMTHRRLVRLKIILMLNRTQFITVIRLIILNKI